MVFWQKRPTYWVGKRYFKLAIANKLWGVQKEKSVSLRVAFLKSLQVTDLESTMKKEKKF